MNAQQIAEAIRTLEQLREEGLLSQEECAREKTQLLQQLRQSVDATEEAQPPSRLGPAAAGQAGGSADPFVTGAGAAGSDFFGTGGASAPMQASVQTPIPGRDVVAQASEVLSSSGAPQTGPGSGVSTGLLPQGSLIRGRYEVRRLLGQGGMGAVYLVLDRVRGREIALKQIHPQLGRDPKIRERFLHELHVNEHLTHPGIVRTYAIDEDETLGTFFFTMEYVEADSLDRRLQGAKERGLVPPLPLHESLVLFESLCEILEYAHAQGVVHRDLKPANILLLSDGRPKLMDFGIAKILQEGQASHHTGFVGTVYYMAPEQLKGGEVSPATDIYSLGILAYQLLTGEIFQGGMPGPSVLNEILPPAIDDVIQKASFWRPEGRYASAKAFWEAFALALDGDGGAKEKVPSRRKDRRDRKPSSRRKRGQQEEPADSGNFVDIFRRALDEATEQVTNLGVWGVLEQLSRQSAPAAERDSIEDFRQLIELACADGVLSPQRRTELLKRGKRLGLSPKEIDAIIEDAFMRLGSKTASRRGRKRRSHKKGAKELQPGLKQLVQLSGHEDWVTSCAISSCGRWILTGGWDCTLRLWSRRKGRLLQTFTGPKDAVTDCSFSPQDDRMIAVSRDGSLWQWQFKDRDNVKTWQAQEVAVACASHAPNMDWLVTAGWDASIHLWEMRSGERLRSFSSYEAVRRCRFDALGGRFLAVCDDGCIRVWDPADGRLLHTLTSAQRLFQDACFFGESQLLSVDEGGAMLLWDLASASIVHTFDTQGDALLCCDSTPDGKLLLAGSADGTLALWDGQQKEFIDSLRAHQRPIVRCVLHPTRGLALTAGHDQQAWLWSVSGE